jgi:hypothetical protein
MIPPRKISIILIAALLFFGVWILKANGSKTQIPAGKAVIYNTTTEDVVFYVRKASFKPGVWEKKVLQPGDDDLYDSNQIVMIITKNKGTHVYKLAGRSRYQIVVNSSGVLELRQIVIMTPKPRG